MGMNILIIRDVAREGDFLEKLLAEQKYLVDVVCSGDDGKDYVRSGRYDVIVLDIAQPRQETFDVIRWMRENRCVAPVLLLSGKADVQDCVKALDSGSDDYMSRPFASEELIRTVILKASETGAAAPAVPVKDTIKIANNGVVETTPDRATLFAVQTPQVFDADLIRAALQKALDDGAEITDDCSAVERLGMKVSLTNGEERNFKLTTPADYALAEYLMSEG